MVVGNPGAAIRSSSRSLHNYDEASQKLTVERSLKRTEVPVVAINHLSMGAGWHLIQFQTTAYLVHSRSRNLNLSLLNAIETILPPSHLSQVALL